MTGLLFSILWLAACCMLADDYEQRINKKGIYSDDEQ